MHINSDNDRKESKFFYDFIERASSFQGFLVSLIFSLVFFIFGVYLVYSYKEDSQQSQMFIIQSEIQNFEISEMDKNHRLNKLIAVNIIDQKSGQSFFSIGTEFELKRIDSTISLINEKAKSESDENLMKISSKLDEIFKEKLKKTDLISSIFQVPIPLMAWCLFFILNVKINRKTKGINLN